MFLVFFLFFFNDPPTTEIYTLSLHDALPIWRPGPGALHSRGRASARTSSRCPRRTTRRRARTRQCRASDGCTPAACASRTPRTRGCPSGNGRPSISSEQPAHRRRDPARLTRVELRVAADRRAIEGVADVGHAQVVLHRTVRVRRGEV